MKDFKVIEVKRSIFEDNNADADKLRAELKSEGTFLLNLMSSPGAGKTTTLKRTISMLKDEMKIGVMEADIDSDVDAQAISETGVRAIQIHTGGMCHLDADMTRQFQKSAALLLKSLGGLDLSSKPKIRFMDEAMQIKTNQKSADFPYEKMETLVETPSLFLLTHSGSATVLQKKDLILGTPEEFLDFFRAHAACPCAKLTEE